MKSGLKYNLVTALLKSDNKEIEIFLLRYILGKKVSVKELWQLPEPQKMIKTKIKWILRISRKRGVWKERKLESV
jgi:hypothetical protein